MRIPGVAALCALALTAGCHSDTTPSPAAAPTRPKPTVARRGPTPEELTVGMVEAVAQGKSPLAADIKFELSDRPIVGQALDVAIAITPKIAASPATLSMSTNADLELVAGYDHIEIPTVEAGEVYRNTIHVVPKQEGVALLGIELTLKHDDLVETKSFSIPLLVAAK